MSIEEAIFLVDELKPNQIERARKIEWLSRLDRSIFEEVFMKHKGDADTPESFTGYSQETNPDTELLAKEPHEEMYRFYLEMQIDLVNLEYDKYNNDELLYSEALNSFKRAYHREHEPLAEGMGFRF
ncbi:MAG: hypothetical protein IJS41_11930 [Clostridia bacterium]|nr:hypothetical protein [Clostridia bacterium]